LNRRGIAREMCRGKAQHASRRVCDGVVLDLVGDERRLREQDEAEHAEHGGAALARSYPRCKRNDLTGPCAQSDCLYDFPRLAPENLECQLWRRHGAAMYSRPSANMPDT
jgi:hypothetical protein